MKGWVAAAGTAATVCACWLAIAFAVPSWHRLVFRFVPADGPVSSEDRTTLDRGIAGFFIGGPAPAGLTVTEQDHLSDVRSFWHRLVVAAATGLCWLIAARPREARRALAIILAVGAASLLAFGPLFVLIHPLVFPQGNWQFSSDALLVQIYPLGFFACIWASVLVVAVASLVLLARGQSSRPRP